MDFYSTRDADLLQKFTKCGYIYKSPAIGDKHQVLLSCLNCKEVFWQLGNFLEHLTKHTANGDLYAEAIEEDSLDIEDTIIKTEKIECQSENVFPDVKQHDNNGEAFTMSEEFSNYFTNPQNNSISQRTITTLEPSTINQHNVMHTPNSEEIANQVVAAIQPTLTRLKNEVQSLHKELHEPKKVQIKCTIMPAQPFKEIEPFFDFEKRLQENGENFLFFENELTVVAKAPNFIKNCWRKIITDELGKQLCWKGTETKRSVRNLITTKAIRNAALLVGNTEDKFIKDTQTFFRFAKNRIKRRKNYKDDNNI